MLVSNKAMKQGDEADGLLPSRPLQSKARADSARSLSPGR